MKPTYLPIGLSTAYLTIYILLVIYNQASWASLLFGLSPLVVIWLVYRVLKDGKYPENRKWSEDSPESMYESY
jgi:hypothetical protein